MHDSGPRRLSTGPPPANKHGPVIWIPGVVHPRGIHDQRGRAAFDNGQGFTMALHGSRLRTERDVDTSGAAGGLGYRLL